MADSGGSGGSSDDDAGTGSSTATPAVQCGSPGRWHDGGRRESRLLAPERRLGDSCSNYRTVRVCQASGQLSGDASFRYAACATGVAEDCALPLGRLTRARCEHFLAYREGTVPYTAAVCDGNARATTAF